MADLPIKMPDVKSDLNDTQTVIVKDTTPQAAAVTAMQTRMELRQKRIRDIQENSSGPDLSVYVGDDSPDEVAFGQSNKVLMSEKGFRVALGANPANPEPLKIHKDESKIQPSTKMLDIGSGFNDVAYNNVVFNRRAQSAPPNIVNYYPLLMTLPPNIISGKNKHMMQEISKVLQLLGGARG